MRTNKTVLDEAARSVRRTFIGSFAGTFGMMGVVGAAGAYGMPERLNAQSLSNAFASLHVKFSPRIERAGVERARTLAGGMSRPARAAMPAPEEPAMPAPTPQPPQVAAIATIPAAAAAPAKFTLASVPPTVAAAERFDPHPAAPVAVTGASPARPDDAAARDAFAALPAFAAPPPLDASPAPDTRERSPTPEIATAPKADTKIDTKTEAVRNTVESPKTVRVRLPPPKAPLTPAQRLGLRGGDYDRAERCLAQAVYFEARNEPARGQMAVAQVVLNRVFSPYYPKDVCSVVYQNAHRHLSCQFTFACDGKSEAIRERGAWARAQRIARQTLEAKIWLPEVAKATHYHAAYVRPYWVREMNVMARFGLHTFYRPRQWGDGHNEPGWGAGAIKKGQSS